MNTRIIPFFNYPFLFNQYETELSGIIQGVCKRGAFIMQEDLFQFERSLAKLLNVKHAIGLADGTMALIIGLKAAGIKPGDEVLVPSHTFVATAAAIHHVGAIPVLVDSGRDHLIDPADLESKISSKTRGLLPVHLNGRTSKMDVIQGIAHKHNLVIVEDACQALGSRFRDGFAGTFGACGAFSFYPSKTLGCFGDGGALVTNDDGVAEVALALRDHGRGKNGDVGCFGFNSRLDNIQAAILNFRLTHYSKEIDKRRSLAGIYEANLGGVKQLLLPPAPNSSSDHFDIYQNYEIEAERRDGLRQYLQDRGVGTIMPWGGKAIHQFAGLGLKEKPRNTDRMTGLWLMLPMNVSLSNSDVEYVCDVIKDFYRTN